MAVSAEALVEAAPLGALVSYSDGRPRPPARFKRRLVEWRRFNGVGRLDSVTPAERRGTHEVPARFVLHVGDFGLFGAIALTVRMCFDARSPLTFSVVDAAPGAVVGVVTDGAHLELVDAFADIDAASCWLARRLDERASLSRCSPTYRCAGCRPSSPPSPHKEEDQGLVDRGMGRTAEEPLAGRPKRLLRGASARRRHA